MAIKWNSSVGRNPGSRSPLDCFSVLNLSVQQISAKFRPLLYSLWRSLLEGISAHPLIERNYIFFREKLCLVLASASLRWRHNRTNMEKSSYCCCYSHGHFNTGERNFHLSKPHSSPHTEQHTSPLQAEAKLSILCNKNSHNSARIFFQILWLWNPGDRWL